MLETTVEQPNLEILSALLAAAIVRKITNGNQTITKSPAHCG
jgi:hypothetical protein